MTSATNGVTLQHEPQNNAGENQHEAKSDTQGNIEMAIPEDEEFPGFYEDYPYEVQYDDMDDDMDTPGAENGGYEYMEYVTEDIEVPEDIEDISEADVVDSSKAAYGAPENVDDFSPYINYIHDNVPGVPEAVNATPEDVDDVREEEEDVPKDVEVISKDDSTGTEDEASENNMHGFAEDVAVAPEVGVYATEDVSDVPKDSADVPLDYGMGKYKDILEAGNGDPADVEDAPEDAGRNITEVAGALKDETAVTPID